jgi:tetratricopeptide (TPR) repeat protein
MLALQFLSIAIICSCLLPLNAAETAKDELIQKYNRDGIAAYRNHDFAEAERNYLQALELARSLDDKGDSAASVLNNMAALKRAQGDEAGAKKLEQQVEEIRNKPAAPIQPSAADPRDDVRKKASAIKLLNDQAHAYEKEQKFAEAELSYQQALVLLNTMPGPEPATRATLLDNLGSVYFRIHQLDKAAMVREEAVKEYANALGKSHPDYAIALTHLANVYAAQGKLEKALAMAKESWEIHCASSGKESAIARKSYGHYMDILELAKGTAAARSAPRLSFDPAKIGMSSKVADFIEAGNLDKAFAMATADAAKNPGKDSYIVAAVIAVHRKDPFHAVQNYTSALKYAPKQANLYERRGAELCKLGRYREAINDFKKTLQLEPTWGTVHFMLGTTYLELQKPGEAIAPLSKAIELDGSLPLPYAVRGAAYKALGKTEESRRDVARAKELGIENYLRDKR